MRTDNSSPPLHQATFAKRARQIVRTIALGALVWMVVASPKVGAQMSQATQPLIDGRVRLNLDSASARRSSAELRDRARQTLRAFESVGHRPAQIEVFDLGRRQVVATFTRQELTE